MRSRARITAFVAAILPMALIPMPYPKVAVYKGKGDTNDAADFVCRDPNAKAGL